MKRYIITIVALLLCSVYTTPVSAIYETEPVIPVVAAATTEISPYNNETVWHYRTNNGVLEKRLWSVTHNCWLTDWMPA